ncbi:PaaX family transcriptional regulator C-terminal domain-containing protein [Paenibacillus sp. YPG26]|uniref:PaaX family transcriptional regulator C-terminal domain-containing protein n=1 Tax=Paenibacillus sp. YPG26 TaxID=2878915 RepID=UPI0020416E2A|nr:PaaX family transcriptional regulator C-terminal domain-containing protein [Paenibacillus sp. YPG26]USB31650.1 PaaX family transcriptional regulator [Paenibacillus sp. YPG26]
MISIDKQILFLLTKASTITIQRFIEIYTARGYLAQSIRNVVSNLKREGYIEAVARSCYSITEHGRSTLTSIASKGFHYGEKWDGEWQLVTFEIPEVERAKRYRLVQSLLNLGFAELHKNTYISPWNYTEEIHRLSERLELGAYLTQMKGIFHHFKIDAALAARMWKLDTIRTAHTEKWAWFQDSFLPSARLYKKEKNALQLFILYLELGEKMGELTILDPMLPAELLPGDWRGQEIMSEFYAEFSTLHQDVPKENYYYELMTSD